MSNIPSDALHIVKRALSADAPREARELLGQAVREVHDRLARARRTCPSVDLSEAVLRLAAEQQT